MLTIDDLATVAADDAPDAAERFSVVPVTDLGHAVIEAPVSWWGDYLPAGAVTLLGAHGGVGKSTIGLMLGVCIATGCALFGKPVRRGVAAYYSGEDPAAVVRWRLRLICRALDVDPAALEDRLHILDATGGDPVLYHEAQRLRVGATTPSYAALVAYLDRHGVEALIVDNATDAFDASEIARSLVRGFMRSLARIAQRRNGAVLLLAHVDKATARGFASGADAYSGSTAWHNSARSRLFLSRDSDGALLLEHQKGNLVAGLAEPLRLRWARDDVPQVDEPPGPAVQAICERTETNELLRLIYEFTLRGEFVSTATTSRTHAGKLLRREPGFPQRLADSALFDLLRKAERRGLLARESFKGADRHTRERWGVTPLGIAEAGIAATAATAATSEVPALRGYP